MQLFRATVLLLFLSPFFTLSGQIGGLKPAPGKSAYGKLAVPPGPDGAVEIPLVVIQGLVPGPTVAVIAGEQGTDAAAIFAVQQFVRDFLATQLKGTLVLIPIANPPSFMARSGLAGAGDHKPLIHSFPGKPDGTIMERIAHTLNTEILAKATSVIELRSGEVSEFVAPHTYQYVTGDGKLDARNAAMAGAFGISLIVVDRQSTGGSARAANALGKPAIMVKSGGMGNPERTAADGMIRGIHSVLSMLEMFPGRAMTGQGATFLEETRLTSPANGTLQVYVGRGDRLMKGSPVVGIADYFGRDPQILRAPIDGIVLTLSVSPPINKGETVAIIGKPKE